jgi:hypothetical protein
MVQPLLDFCYREWRKAEARAPTLNSGYYLIDVVAYDAETDILCVLLNDTAQCSLRRGSHHVCLIQYDEFETF